MSISRKPPLLFAVESPFSLRDWQRFGINELSEFFDVSIIDLTALSKPALVVSRGHDLLTDEKIHRISSKSEIPQFFHLQKPAALLNNVGVGEIRHLLFRLAKTNNVLFAEFQLGAIPSVFSFSTNNKIIQRLRQLPSLSDLPQAVIHKIKNQYWTDCLPDVFFRAGKKARGRHPRLGASVIEVHSLDYEFSLDFITNRQRPNERRIAYLDQDIGYHSDVVGLGLRHAATPEHFYPRINSYFDWLEREKDFQVVICQHPRTNRAQTEKRFPGRSISGESTCNELSQCGSVMGHWSTSFSYAVLHKRPALILSTSEIARSWYAPYTETFSRELAAPLVNIDDRKSWIQPTTTLTEDQHDAYTSYELNYLKSYEGPAPKLWTMIGEAMLRRIGG